MRIDITDIRIYPGSIPKDGYSDSIKHIQNNTLKDNFLYTIFQLSAMKSARMAGALVLTDVSAIMATNRHSAGKSKTFYIS